MSRHVLYDGRVVVDFHEVGHKYEVTVDGVEVEPYASVTKVTSAIDMGKSGAFAWWASGEATNFLRQSWPKSADGSVYLGRSIAEAEELFKGAYKAHAGTRDEAAAIGKDVHAWIDSYIESKQTFGQTPALPEDEATRNAVTAFIQNEQEHGVSYVDSEKVVYSLKDNVIGTLDQTRLTMVDGALCLTDNKTSDGMRLSFRAQLAAYAKYYMEEHPEVQIGKRYVYLLGKKEPTFTPVDLKYDDMTDEESLEFDYHAFEAAIEIYRWGIRAKAEND